MSNQVIFIIMGVSVALMVVIGIAYYIMNKKMQKSDYKKIQNLQRGTKASAFSSEIMYQKLYIFFSRVPFIKRYVLKLRRRLEILNIDDEYITRRDVAKILTKALVILIPLIIITILVTKSNYLLMFILLIFELFMIDILIEGSVDKKDNELLTQQLDFFSEIRHAYHEFNMVEEAIYQVSQDDEKEISRQGEKIYEILTSDDPETELEKYYDVAPNSYLKEFAGISYLTREFGDRTIDGASLYLKNLNNITQEMQLEILKRDKLDYVFQSLSVIAMLPVLCLQPLRNWAVSNFSFTSQFYDGKLGLIAQIILIIATLICYILTRKLKDSGAIKDEYKDPNNVWQMKLYKNPVAKKIIDLFIPKEKTKEYRKMIKLMKESATKQKLETVYVNRLTICVVTFLCSILLFLQLHNVAVDYVYNEPTSD